MAIAEYSVAELAETVIDTIAEHFDDLGDGIQAVKDSTGVVVQCPMLVVVYGPKDKEGGRARLGTIGLKASEYTYEITVSFDFTTAHTSMAQEDIEGIVQGAADDFQTFLESELDVPYGASYRFDVDQL